MKWWESKKDGETEEIRLPNEIQEQLDQVKGLKTTVDEQAAKLSKLDGIEQMLTRPRLMKKLRLRMKRFQLCS